MESNIFLSGFLAGTAQTFIGHPFDTIKTCMQGDIEKKKYTTTINTAKTLIQENTVGKVLSVRAESGFYLPLISS